MHKLVVEFTWDNRYGESWINVGQLRHLLHTAGTIEKETVFIKESDEYVDGSTKIDDTPTIRTILEKARLITRHAWKEKREHTILEDHEERLQRIELALYERLDRPDVYKTKVEMTPEDIKGIFTVPGLGKKWE